MASVAWTASGATTYDLTSVSVNAEAAPTATAREGGFVARNRVTWANVTAPTMTNKVMNVLKLLWVPARTVVTDIYLTAPAGGAATGHGTNSKSCSSATAGLGFIAYKDASLSSATTDADGFGKATVSKSKIHTSSVLALPSDPETNPVGSVRHVVAGANEGQDHGWADNAENNTGMHFPYGGWITFQLLAGKGSVTAAASWDGAFTGRTEISAIGWKIPE